MINIEVSVVIVTYNRKKMLERTLLALLAQTYPIKKIILVDNASTDGTMQFLAEKGFLGMEQITYKPLVENLGGAGGFQIGIEMASDFDSEWIWLMDDDGYPEHDCLEKLLPYKDQYDFYGPLVIDDLTKESLSFPINYAKSNKIFQTKTEIDQFMLEQNTNTLNDILIPFNGVMLNKKLVEKIGVPYAKFFIWGDDIEYTYRARKAGARIATITDVLFFHPRALNLGEKLFFGMMQFNDTDSKIKLYCLCRNNTNNLKVYRSRLHALGFMLKAYWFYTITKPSLEKLKLVNSALWAGWKGNFNKHKAYIGESFK